MWESIPSNTFVDIVRARYVKDMAHKESLSRCPRRSYKRLEPLETTRSSLGGTMVTVLEFTPTTI
jgi:hypothetical protein